MVTKRLRRLIFTDKLPREGTRQTAKDATLMARWLRAAGRSEENTNELDAIVNVEKKGLRSCPGG